MLLKKLLPVGAQDGHYYVPAGSSPAILKKPTPLTLTFSAEVLTTSKTSDQSDEQKAEMICIIPVMLLSYLVISKLIFS